MAELSASTDAAIVSELLSRTPTISPGGIVHQVRYGVLTATFGIGSEKDLASAEFHTDFSNRQQTDLLTVAKEAIETA